MTAEIHADKFGVTNFPTQQTVKPPRRSFIILAALAIFGLGLILVPRPALYYPHVVVEATGTMKFDFLLLPKRDRSACQSSGNTVLNAIFASCRQCVVLSQSCLKNPSADLLVRFDEAPLPVASARMPDGIVTYSATDEAVALVACRESEAQAALKGDQAKVACYPAGTQRPHTPFEKRQDESAHTIFSLLVHLIGAIIAGLVVAIFVTHRRHSALDPRYSTTVFHPWLEKFALAGVDALILFSTFLAFSWPDGADPSRWSQIDKSVVIGYGFVILLAVGWFWFVLQHYSRRRPFWDELREMFRVLAVMFLISSAWLFVGNLEFGRVNHLVVWVLNFLLFPFGRLGAKGLLDDLGLWRAPAVIIGAGDSARIAYDAIKCDQSMGYRVVAVLAIAKEPYSADCWKNEQVPVIEVGDEFESVLSGLGGPHVFVALEDVYRQDMTAMIHRLIDTQINVHLIPNVKLLPLLSADLSPFLRHEVALLTFKNNLNRASVRVAKRSIDVLLSAVGIVVSSPVVAIAALCIFAQSLRNPFFAQTREGYDGKNIKVWKLRTMHHDAERLLAEHLRNNADARAEWEKFFKLSDDPRILPYIGNFLRCTSIDELPQLWNVLIGELSLVGPRPFPHYHLEVFSAEFRQLRRKVRPGITGMWQVYARSNGDVTIQEYYDSYYIRNWSIWLDIFILVKTIDAVLTGRGAK